MFAAIAPVLNSYDANCIIAESRLNCQNYYHLGITIFLENCKAILLFNLQPKKIQWTFTTLIHMLTVSNVHSVVVDKFTLCMKIPYTSLPQDTSCALFMYSEQLRSDRTWTDHKCIQKRRTRRIHPTAWDWHCVKAKSANLHLWRQQQPGHLSPALTWSELPGRPRTSAYQRAAPWGRPAPELRLPSYPLARPQLLPSARWSNITGEK